MPVDARHVYVTRYWLWHQTAKRIGLWCLVLAGAALGEHFTSTDAMEDLYDLEVTLIKKLEQYIHHVQNKLSLLAGPNYLARRYEQAVLSLVGVSHVEGYVSNPINSYSLLRRLTVDWPKTLSLVDEGHMGNVTLPRREELAGAARALVRLQDVYRIGTGALASGRLPGTHRRAVLTASDCVSVAHVYTARKDYRFATEWLEQALFKVRLDRSCPAGVVLENLFITYCFQGDEDRSRECLRDLLDAYPRYTPPDYLVANYNQALRGDCSQIALRSEADKIKSVPELETDEIEEYGRWCRAGAASGEVGVSVREGRCRLLGHGPSRIAPFRIEELSLEPPVLLFHNFMSDREITHFRKISFPLMKRAKIILPDGRAGSALYRTSHLAWLEDDDPVVRCVSQRVAAATGLDVSSAEACQVSNYGLAGEYITHMDAVEGVNLTHGDPEGNRLATFMVYMSDVPLGGNTVFPDLGLSVRPRKGAALFWFNLHHDGSIDRRMRHAGCPVVVGAKWVMNKWLHEASQERALRPPCRRRLSDTWKHYYLHM